MSETTPSIPTPTEEIDAELEETALWDELLAELPPLLEPERFRIGHRHAFDDLMLEAQKSGAFDRDELDYDMSKPEDIEDYQKLARFIASIDTWAESIARDPAAYALWSEGKREDHFLALFKKYQHRLGELRGSAN